jgi:hypothetical protein
VTGPAAGARVGVAAQVVDVLVKVALSTAAVMTGVAEDAATIIEDKDTYG